MGSNVLYSDADDLLSIERRPLMIAISYRREDSLPIAGRLYDRLQAEFGRGQVFMDFDSIPYGVDFRDHIKQMIDRSKLVIAVIGADWLGRKGKNRRIDDPTDFVRLEIGYALERNLPIIPVLVGNTRMPKPDQLPKEIEGLAFRNAINLDAGIDFHHHTDRLIAGINRLTAASLADPQKNPPLVISNKTSTPPVPKVFTELPKKERPQPANPTVEPPKQEPKPAPKPVSAAPVEAIAVNLPKNVPSLPKTSAQSPSARPSITPPEKIPKSKSESEQRQVAAASSVHKPTIDSPKEAQSSIAPPAFSKPPSDQLPSHPPAASSKLKSEPPPAVPTRRTDAVADAIGEKPGGLFQKPDSSLPPKLPPRPPTVFPSKSIRSDSVPQEPGWFTRVQRSIIRLQNRVMADYVRPFDIVRWSKLLQERLARKQIILLGAGIVSVILLSAIWFIGMRPQLRKTDATLTSPQTEVKIVPATSSVAASASAESQSVLPTPETLPPEQKPDLGLQASKDMAAAGTSKSSSTETFSSSSPAPSQVPTDSVAPQQSGSESQFSRNNRT